MRAFLASFGVPVEMDMCFKQKIWAPLREYLKFMGYIGLMGEDLGNKLPATLRKVPTCSF